MLKTESLAVFALVADYRSFTQTAKALDKTPMAISKQISQLEQLLGESLFERSTRRIRLTEFGEAFLVRTRHIMADHDALQQWLESRTGRYSGVLKIVAQDGQTFDETIFPWLSEFHKLYPDIELTFDVQESIIDINLAPYDIYWGVSEYLGTQFPSLKRRSLWKAKLGIFASPEYLAKYGRPNHPDDLNHHRMIGHPHGSPSNALVVNKTEQSVSNEIQTVELNAPIKSVNRQSLMCAQGLGIINALEDNQDIKGYVKSGQLVPILEPYWYASAEIFIYYQRVKFDQPKVRAFIDFFLAKKPLW
ncbi:LysR family transcriptional regulator [uncultured Paraglaciecola sp.]|uniref:LysR family transcriptional regulator n=1 Tax=uncultured Paraglaciecola sp. TaxID=1765024 RepID=UPI002624A62D|nr:LysR family transcriptional regulator [uncultured Paraglaciecola sp.]